MAYTSISSGTLDMHGFNQTLGMLGSGFMLPLSAFITNNGAAGTLSVLTLNTLTTGGGNTASGNNAAVVNTANNTSGNYWAGSIPGWHRSGRRCVPGQGHNVLTAPNNYTGGTTVLSGTLELVAPSGSCRLQRPSSLGSGALTVLNLNTGVGSSTVLGFEQWLADSWFAECRHCRWRHRGHTFKRN